MVVKRIFAIFGAAASEFGVPNSFPVTCLYPSASWWPLLCPLSAVTAGLRPLCESLPPSLLLPLKGLLSIPRLTLQLGHFSISLGGRGAPFASQALSTFDSNLF